MFNDTEYMGRRARAEHCGVRGWFGDVAGSIAVATGAGPYQVGRWLHQLVPPDEDPTSDHGSLPGRQREQRADPDDPGSGHHDADRVRAAFGEGRPEGDPRG
uniref:(northern house mosquito) hypothetical protein n=1 Tax=Culex pipiens TaxID=7175 RepID=A0A8D8BFY1_CULPI